MTRALPSCFWAVWGCSAVWPVAESCTLLSQPSSSPSYSTAGFFARRCRVSAALPIENECFFGGLIGKLDSPPDPRAWVTRARPRWLIPAQPSVAPAGVSAFARAPVPSTAGERRVCRKHKCADLDQFQPQRAAASRVGWVLCKPSRRIASQSVDCAAAVRLPVTSEPRWLPPGGPGCRGR
jgi:hypothetical protein